MCAELIYACYITTECQKRTRSKKGHRLHQLSIIVIGLDQMYILIELGGVANRASHSPSGYTIQIDMRTHCSIRTTLSVEASKWKCVVEIES